MYKVNAVIFDFDGVLIQSVDIKTRAFAELYREFGQGAVDLVVSYHLAHGGVSRYDKFRHIHNVLIPPPLSENELAQLVCRFSALVEDAVVEAPWVAGAKEFLEQNYTLLPMFVASGTPDEELKRIIGRRGIDRFFMSVHGSPLPKREIIDRIVAKHDYKRDRVVMVGDAMTDYEESKHSGVRFIAKVDLGAPSIFPDDVSVISDLFNLPDFLC